MQNQETDVKTLPNHFLIAATSSTQASMIQKMMLKMGYRWHNTGPCSPDDEIRPGPHKAIRAWTEHPGKKKMVRIVSQSVLNPFLEDRNVVKLTRAEVAELVRYSKSFRTNATVGSGPKMTNETAAYFVDRYRKDHPIFAGVDMANTNRTKRWSFGAPHAAAIDFASIASDISYREPVALVRDTKGGPDDLAWLVVHHKILLKAKLIGHELENAMNGDCYPVRDGSLNMVKRIKLRESGALIDMIKDVKGRHWPRGGVDGKRRKIEVTLPRV